METQVFGAMDVAPLAALKMLAMVGVPDGAVGFVELIVVPFGVMV